MIHDRRLIKWIVFCQNLKFIPFKHPNASLDRSPDQLVHHKCCYPVMINDANVSYAYE